MYYVDDDSLNDSKSYDMYYVDDDLLNDSKYYAMYYVDDDLLNTLTRDSKYWCISSCTNYTITKPPISTSFV